MDRANPDSRRWGGFGPLYAAVCVVGATVSLLSTLDHIEFKRTGGDAAGFCAALVDRGCGAAHRAPASEIFGIPISLFGLAFYLALGLGAALSAWDRPRLAGLPLPGRRVPVVLAAAGVASLGYSAYLASVLIRLGEMCPFCATLYVVNATLLVLAVAWAWPWWRAPADALRSAIRPAVFLGAVGGALAAIALPVYLVVMADVRPPEPPKPEVLDHEKAQALAIPDRAPSRGSATAPVTLIEFSDLECPFCERMHETVSALFNRLGPDRIRVRFVHFPLDTSCNCHVSVCLHQTACLAARAATCAGKEGRFWEYSERLYADRRHHARPDLLAHAKAVGLDPDRLDACIDDPETARAVAEDIEIAHRVGVTATPTIVLNGLKIEGAVDLSKLQEILDRSSMCSCDLTSEVCGAHGRVPALGEDTTAACGADLEDLDKPASCGDAP